MLTFQKKLLASAISLALTPSLALAQSGDGANSETEEIVVTGSHIQRSNAETPTPTTVISADDIAKSGLTNVGALLNQLPEISGSITRRGSQQNGGAATTGGSSEVGLELLNLRGLGSQRTLVLVNGRRHVGSRAGDSAVDVSTIPSSMIERIEVITGAASAAYGADAVSGVVNFIMRKDFEGFEVNVTGGRSGHSDGEQKSASFTFGKNFANDRGNITLNYSYDDTEAVYSSTRSYTSLNLGNVPNPADTGPGDGIPERITRTGRVIGALNTSGIAFTPGGLFTFDGQGTPRTYDLGECPEFPTCFNNPDGLILSDFDTLLTPQERHLFSANLNFEVNDNLNFFLESKYAKTDNFQSVQAFDTAALPDGSPLQGPPSLITAENAFVPDQLRTILTDSGAPFFVLNKHDVGLAGGPRRFDKNNLETVQFATGVDGTLSNDWTYSISMQYGKTEGEVRQKDRDRTRYLQAVDSILDSNGNPVCRDSSNGCAPLNLFGPNSASAAAINFITFDTLSKNTLEQTAFSAKISGDAFTLPAGDVLFAAGLEYRKEESESVPDNRLQNPQQFGVSDLTADPRTGDPNPIPITRGEYDVNEVFVEVLVPVLADLPAIQNLNLEGAFRYSDYSTVGGTNAYKVGLDWSVNDAVRLRASSGRAVRAPNIGELFAPAARTNQGVTDPCSAANINSSTTGNTANRIANCAADGIPDNFNPLTDAAGILVANQGNPNLQEESSDTLTLGLVLTPADNLSLSLDYWQIEIDDAIAFFDINRVLANCYDLPNLNNSFCSQFTRDAATRNINSAFTQRINIASLESSGYDVKARYDLELGDLGTLDFGFIASYLKENKETPDPNNPTDVTLRHNTTDNPQWRGNLSTNYNYNDFSTGLNLRYVGSSNRDNPVLPERFDVQSIPSAIYTDLSMSYQVNENLNIFGNVNNLLDKEPPRVEGVAAGTSLYDSIGRYISVGLTYRM